ncbi:MAG: hypothetical protein M0Q02_05945, partial [Candidatus Muirbacterium halophilum]|nr:hypothetical protein [Candidatus Muirbacterium halophilum]
MFFKLIDKIFGIRSELFFLDVVTEHRFRLYDYERCIENYKRLLKEIPEQKDKYNFKLAVCYRNIGNNKKAIKHIDAIIEK